MSLGLALVGCFTWLCLPKINCIIVIINIHYSDIASLSLTHHNHHQPQNSLPNMASSTPSKPPGQSIENYHFPSHRLLSLTDPTKTPIVLVACGSFSPITHMHLRMFEMAVDHVKQSMSSEYEVVGGYMSPVSDRYNKAGLASAAHRYASSPTHPAQKT